MRRGAFILMLFLLSCVLPARAQEDRLHELKERTETLEKKAREKTAEVMEKAAHARDTTEKILRRVDRRMYRQQHRTKVDSAYIAIPEERWTIKTTSNLNWNGLGINHFADGEGYGSWVQSSPKFSQGISVAWRWLEIGASINPAWFFPSLKNDDQSYSISVFGNKFGLTATMRYANTYKGIIWTLPDSTSVSIPLGKTSDLSGDFDAYYAFNGDKFSFPAAFSMMQIQKRSAGSVILSLSVRNGRTIFDGVTYQDTEQMKLYSNMLAVGAGYGHNFVTPHHWLFHVSTMGNLTLLSYNKVVTSTENYRLKQTFPDWITSFQLAALHWKDKWFYGANLTIRSAIYGKREELEFINARVEGNLVFGFRF